MDDLDDAGWTCTVCTYVNQNMTFLSCEICGSIKPSSPKNLHPFFNVKPGSEVLRQKRDKTKKDLAKASESGQIQCIDLSNPDDSVQEHGYTDSDVPCTYRFPAEKDVLDSDGFIILPQSSPLDIACVPTKSSSRAVTQTQRSTASQPLLSRAKVILREHYNSDAELRPFQKRAILSVVAQKRDCLVVSATGSGKSASFT